VVRSPSFATADATLDEIPHPAFIHPILMVPPAAVDLSALGHAHSHSVSGVAGRFAQRSIRCDGNLMG
jgi:hypothetical protein